MPTRPPPPLLEGATLLLRAYRTAGAEAGVDAIAMMAASPASYAVDKERREEGGGSRVAQKEEGQAPCVVGGGGAAAAAVTLARRRRWR